MNICKDYNECISCIYFDECGEKAFIEKGRIGPGFPITAIFLILTLLFFLL